MGTFRAENNPERCIFFVTKRRGLKSFKAVLTFPSPFLFLNNWKYLFHKQNKYYETALEKRNPNNNYVVPNPTLQWSSTRPFPQPTPNFFKTTRNHWSKRTGSFLLCCHGLLQPASALDESLVTKAICKYKPFEISTPNSRKEGRNFFGGGAT